MKNYIEQIAKINKKDRFNSIINILKENEIDYKVEKIDFPTALGNIIVRLGNNSKEKIVVTAHYDNAPSTKGANDNATACAILLKLIISLKNTNKNIEFIFTDLEEIGFIGCNQYLRNNNDKISLAINLDMCGSGNNIIVSKSNIANNESLNELIAKHNCIKLGMLPPGDAYVFIRKNIPTLYVISSTDKDVEWFRSYSLNQRASFNPEFSSHMHTPNDTIDIINFKHVNKIYEFVKEVLEN